MTAMTTREKITTATKPLTHWLAHYAPSTVIAVDADGEEHPIVVTKQKRKWDIVAKAVMAVDAVTVRAMSPEGLLATRTLRTIEAPVGESETAATPATAGGYDVTAVVQCVAREVREAVSDATKAMREMVSDVVREQSKMLKDMSERHSAAEKALLDAREQIMIEREERIAEREAEAERAAQQVQESEARESRELVKNVIGMAMQNPDIVKTAMGALNGSKKVPAIAAPAPTPPKVEGTS